MMVMISWQYRLTLRRYAGESPQPVPSMVRKKRCYIGYNSIRGNISPLHMAAMTMISLMITQTVVKISLTMISLRLAYL